MSTNGLNRPSPALAIITWTAPCSATRRRERLLDAASSETSQWRPVTGGRPGLGQPSDRGRGLLVVAAPDVHRRARVEERLGEPEADAAVPAGHDRDPTLEIPLHCRSGCPSGGASCKATRHEIARRGQRFVFAADGGIPEPVGPLPARGRAARRVVRRRPRRRGAALAPAGAHDRRHVHRVVGATAPARSGRSRTAAAHRRAPCRTGRSSTGRCSARTTGGATTRAARS